MEHQTGTDLRRVRELAESIDHILEEDAAELARVKLETLEAWRKRGQGPAWVRWGNRVMYPRAALREFLQKQVHVRNVVPAKASL